MRDRAATRLATLRGIPQKMGQLFAMFGTSENPNMNSPFADLYEVEEKIPRRRLMRQLEQVWQRNPESIVRSVSPTGLSGSIGRVHRATLQSGDAVAVKLLHPGIDKQIKSDLKWLKWAPAPKINGNRQDLSVIRQYLQRKFVEESDLSIERKHLEQVACWQIPNIVVPKTYPEFSNPEVLVTSWEVGETIESVAQTWSRPDRRRAAETLFQFFLIGLFRHEKLQADWNPGNFRFRKTDQGVQLIVFDLGSAFEPKDQQDLAILKLIQTAMENRESPLPSYLAAGFKGEFLEPISHLLPALSGLLLEPFLEDRPFELAEWNLSKRMKLLLGEFRWNFRVAAPAHLLFLVRALNGFCLLLRRLDVKLNWHQAVLPFLKDRSQELGSMTLPRPVQEQEFVGLSQHLKIKVVRDSVTRVELILPARAIESLNDFLDAELQRKIRERHIILSKLVDRVRQSGYRPQQVFRLASESEQIIVELV